MRVKYKATLSVTTAKITEHGGVIYFLIRYVSRISAALFESSQFFRKEINIECSHSTDLESFYNLFSSNTYSKRRK